MLERLAFTQFVAAMAVIFFHLGRGVPDIDDRPWSPIVMTGPVAVTYFFVLSGFIYLLFPALIVLARRTSLLKWCVGAALFLLATHA